MEENEDILSRVARVLQHNHVNHSDKMTCDEFGISERTLQRYKEAFRTREKVANFVALQRKALNERLHAKAVKAFESCADRCIRASLTDDLSPEAMRENNEAMRTLGQFLALDKAIEGRLNGVDVFGDSGTTGLPAPRSVDAEYQIADSDADDPPPDPD